MGTPTPESNRGTRSDSSLGIVMPQRCYRACWTTWLQLKQRYAREAASAAVGCRSAKCFISVPQRTHSRGGAFGALFSGMGYFGGFSATDSSFFSSGAFSELMTDSQLFQASCVGFSGCAVFG